MWPDLRTCLSSRLEPLFSLTCSSSTPRLLFWPVLPQVLSLFPAFVSAAPSAWFTLPPHLAWLTPHLSDLTSDLFLQRNLPGLLSWIRAILHFSVLALNNLLFSYSVFVQCLPYKLREGRDGSVLFSALFPVSRTGLDLLQTLHKHLSLE